MNLANTDAANFVAPGTSLPHRLIRANVRAHVFLIGRKVPDYTVWATSQTTQLSAVSVQDSVLDSPRLQRYVECGRRAAPPAKMSWIR